MREIERTRRDEFEMYPETSKVFLPEDTEDELWIDPGYAGGYAVLFVTIMQDTAFVYDEIYKQGWTGEEMAAAAARHPRWKKIRKIVMDIAGRQHQAGKSQVEIWYEVVRSPGSRNQDRCPGRDPANPHFTETPPGDRCARALYLAPTVSGRWKSSARATVIPLTSRSQIGNSTLDVVINEKPMDARNHSCKAIAYGLIDNFGPVRRRRRGSMAKPARRTTGWDYILMYLTKDRMQTFQTEDPGIWSLRNQNIWRWRRDYSLRKPPQEQAAAWPDLRGHQRSQGHRPKDSGDDQQPPTGYRRALQERSEQAPAQRAEEYLRYYREQEALKFGEGPNGDRAYAEVLKLVRDGMLVDITVFDDSDPDFPFYSCLPDVTRVFPVYAGDTRIRTTYVYDTTVAEVTDDDGPVRRRAGPGHRQVAERQGRRACQGLQGLHRQQEAGLRDGRHWPTTSVLLYAEIGFDPVTITYVIGDTDTAPDESLEPGEATTTHALGRAAQRGRGPGDS